jgi:hypothetical protein
MDAEHQPISDRVLVTVPDLFKFIDDFIDKVARKGQDQSESEITIQSSKHSLLSLVESANEPVSALGAGDLALGSLRLGMLTGVWEGWRLSFSEPWEEVPEIAESSPVYRHWTTLCSNLNDVRKMAHDNWKAMEKDDLHLLWKYGRHQNLDTLVEASRYAGDKDPEPFQKFLLATFKSGYAVAVAQAVWEFPSDP